RVSQKLKARLVSWRQIPISFAQFLSPGKRAKYLISKADVTELVDARDLKCLAIPERSHLFWKTRSHFRHQPARTKRDLENIFGGPLMALTGDTLFAAMRTVRALHLHCRRIVFTSTTLKDSIQTSDTR